MHDTPTATPPSASTTLPADVHAVVFFDGPRGREHIDTHVLSDGATTTIAGVHADESRAHPVPQRVEFTPQERAEYARLVAALATMPRCEPLARLPDEPTWQIEFGGQGDTGPSLWFREDGDALLASDDPCLAYVRLARFFYATWMRGARPR